MSSTVLLLVAAGYIFMGLLHAMDNHSFVALLDFVIAAGCIFMTRWVR